MATVRVGQRVRFSEGDDDARSGNGPCRDVWEGVIVMVAWNAEGRQVVTVKVGRRNGLPCRGLRDVHSDAVDWGTS
jgi:hypothetical protein